jgi:hypothetical protein
MKTPLLLLIFLMPWVASAGDAPGATESIDRLLEAHYLKAGVTPNAPVNDERFLRRLYLDVTGRIPTVAEARAFLDSTHPDKRARLIDELLTSEAAVSHGFNFWADILRLNEELGNNRFHTYAYSFWLKDALRKNLAYDEMVRELITARGWIWENGATAYYHRDRGMPLDNMSNTVRVFLGTRLECAQCHNHPFDRWTQMEYYQMAALSHTMDTRLFAPAGRSAIGEYQREFMEKARAKAPQGVVPPGSADYLRHKAIGQVNADLFAFMKYVLCRETPEMLVLPHDYQYDDAKPGDPVAPTTMFGAKIKADSTDGLIEAYADWMTSPENPRFASVIANRLWKRVMGRGLVEPVDEWMDQTAASHPELLAFLTRRMIELRFDMRAFQKEIYNTRAYQREMIDTDLPLGEPCHFQGPVMRRLNAEQWWDSLVTLSIPHADYYMPKMDLRLAQLDRLRQIKADLDTRTEQDFIRLAKEFADHYAENYQRVEELSARHKAALEDRDEEKAAEIGKELNAIRNAEQGHLRKMIHGDRVNGGRARDVYAAFGIGGKTLPLEKIVTTPAPPRSGPNVQAEYAVWRSLTSDLMRASELESPAPIGHFLREFGQSDREVIENASDGASVPQALALLNGPFAEILSHSCSVLQTEMAGAPTPEAKFDCLMLATLSRHPSDKERATFRKEFERNGDAAFGHFLWAIVNSQQFRFVY